MSSTLVGIRRYPVKSTGGESVQAAVLTARGLQGDRLWAVADSDGRLATGKNTARFRRMDPVFDLWSRGGANGAPPEVRFPDGSWVSVADPAAESRLAAHLGTPTRFTCESEAVSHMDAGRVSLVGTGSLGALAHLLDESEPVDPRRFRANLLVDLSAWEEESWVGHRVSVGEVVLEVVERIERCRTVDVAQGGVAAHGRVLRTLGGARDVCLAVYADVIEPGSVHIGDSVEPI